MSISDDIEKIEKKANAIEAESFAKTFLEEFKKANQRLFTTIIMLFILIAVLLAYSGYITYQYITTGTETITKIADTEGDGNACIGDDCYNGDIYG